MATVGARLHRRGSVYSRIRELLRSGVLAYDDRPRWYDVYKAFPPIREPTYMKEPGPDEFGLVNVEDNVRNILYNEDWARATFNKHYKGKDKQPVSMFVDEHKMLAGKPNLSMRFVNEFRKHQKTYPNLPKEKIFEVTLSSLHIKQ